MKMYKAKSVPKNLNEADCSELTENLLSKSPSYDNFMMYAKDSKPEFEGDGPLGIGANIDEKISGIKDRRGTVAVNLLN